MDAFGQAQTTIRSALNNFLPKTIESAAGQKWYQQPGTPRSNTKNKNAFSNPFVLGTQRGFLADNSYDNLMYRKQAEMMAASLSNPGTGQGQGGGGMGDPGGAEWAKVNQWNGLINSAIARVQSELGISVPGNVVKAVMKLESGGENVGCNAWGYCGLMQTGSGSWINNFDPNVNRTPEGNIYYGVQELANWYKAVGTGNWEDAAAAYFSGYNYNKPDVSDGYGTTVGQYRNIIRQNLAALNSAGGGATGGTGQWGGSGGGRGVFSLFGPGASNGFDFGVSSSNGLYGYGTSYGLDGTQHTGLDVMQPLGSPLYAPGGATVVCVGCWRNDHLTGGVGRIELEMPDGARVLYDHTYSSTVRVGDRVTAGQLIGTSGGMYSPHTHLEVRVPDSSQSSGYRLVDPVAYFGGYTGGGAGGFMGQGQSTAPPRQLGWDRLRQILAGR
jgi:murein DD-endopeptidase MepM/ murein hydrolase activator NlpD